MHVPQTKLLHSGLRQEAVIYSVAGQKKKKKKASGEDLLLDAPEYTLWLI